MVVVVLAVATPEAFLVVVVLVVVVMVEAVVVAIVAVCRTCHKTAQPTSLYVRSCYYCSSSSSSSSCSSSPYYHSHTFCSYNYYYSHFLVTCQRKTNTTSLEVSSC